MARALHQKPKPKVRTPAEEMVDVVLGPYGNLVARLRREVMAGQLQPAEISRAETSDRLSEELGRAPYVHEISAALAEAGRPDQSEVWDERRAMFERDKDAPEQWRGKGSRQAAVAAAYDKAETEEEYAEFLAKLDVGSE
jgi:hypothetical protein